MTWGRNAVRYDGIIRMIYDACYSSKTPMKLRCDLKWPDGLNLDMKSFTGSIKGVSYGRLRALYDYTAVTEVDLSIREGELLLLIDDSSGDWWYVRHAFGNNDIRRMEGYVPCNYVAKENTLKAQEWVMKNMSRQEAEKHLMTRGYEPGTYLIRKVHHYTDPTVGYVLSLRDFDPVKGYVVKHYRIHSTDNGGCYIAKRKTFSNVTELVEHYANQADGLCRTLARACPTENVSFSGLLEANPSYKFNIPIALYTKDEKDQICQATHLYDNKLFPGMSITIADETSCVGCLVNLPDGEDIGLIALSANYDHVKPGQVVVTQSESTWSRLGLVKSVIPWYVIIQITQKDLLPKDIASLSVVRFHLGGYARYTPRKFRGRTLPMDKLETKRKDNSPLFIFRRHSVISAYIDEVFMPKSPTFTLLKGKRGSSGNVLGCPVFSVEKGELLYVGLLCEVNTVVHIDYLLKEFSVNTLYATGNVKTLDIPLEILRMEGEDIRLYHKALEEGEEKNYNIRLMAVGHGGVGKSTLTRRLLQQPVNIKEYNSTNGVEVHVRKCEVDIETGKWVFRPTGSGEGKRSLLRRMKTIFGFTEAHEELVEEEEDNEADYRRRCAKLLKKHDDMEGGSDDDGFFMEDSDEVIYSTLDELDTSSQQVQIHLDQSLPSGSETTVDPQMLLQKQTPIQERSEDQSGVMDTSDLVLYYRLDEIENPTKQEQNRLEKSQTSGSEISDDPPTQRSDSKTFAVTTNSATFKDAENAVYTMATKQKELIPQACDQIDGASKLELASSPNGSKDGKSIGNVKSIVARLEARQQEYVEQNSEEAEIQSDNDVFAANANGSTDDTAKNDVDPSCGCTPDDGKEAETSGSPITESEKYNTGKGTIDKTASKVQSVKTSTKSKSSYQNEERKHVDNEQTSDEDDYSYPNSLPAKAKTTDVRPIYEEAIKVKGYEAGEKAKVSFFDFAGQYVFYGSHLTFLSPRAIYLLVLNLKLLKSQSVIPGSVFGNFNKNCLQTSFDYLKHWLQVIFMFALSRGKPKPQVILVGTHADKLPKKKRDEIKETYFKEVRKKLADSPLLDLLSSNDFLVDNTNPNDPGYDLIREEIFRLARSHTHSWGEKTPSKWLPLEKELRNMKKEGVKVISVDTLKQVNQKLHARIDSEKELDLFLRFHHDCGDIVFYSDGNLAKNVMLDPVWLIGALRCIITCEKFAIKIPRLIKEWLEFSTTGLIRQEAVVDIWKHANDNSFYEHRDHLLAIMDRMLFFATPVCNSDEDECSSNAETDPVYIVPCMVQKELQDRDHLTKALAKGERRTSAFCMVYGIKFLPPAAFHKLVAACIAKWPIAEDSRRQKQIFCGFCIFNLDRTKNHKLALVLVEYAIHAVVITYKKQESLADVCGSVKTFLQKSFQMVLRGMGVIDEFEKYIQCPRISYLENKGYLDVETIKKSDGVTCDDCEEPHYLPTRELLHDWTDLPDQNGKEVIVEEARIESQSELEINKIEPNGKEDETEESTNEGTVAQPSGYRMTAEHMNHARLCNVLLTLCSDALREILESNPPPPHQSIYTALLANKPALTTKRQVRPGVWQNALLNKDQRYTVYVGPQGNYCASVEEFDLSLLYTLIRNVSDVQPHQSGWGNKPVDQPVRDTCLAANVERLRLIRNATSGHSTDGRIENQTFEDYWGDIKEILKEIEVVIGHKGYEEPIDDLRNQPVLQEEAQKLQRKFKKMQAEVLRTVDEVQKTVDEAQKKLEEIKQATCT